jgi:hypothetical protein
MMQFTITVAILYLSSIVASQASYYDLCSASDRKVLLLPINVHQDMG